MNYKSPTINCRACLQLIVYVYSDLYRPYTLGTYAQSLLKNIDSQKIRINSTFFLSFFFLLNFYLQISVTCLYL